MKTFYVSCALGFEEPLLAEIREIWPFLLGKDGRPHAEPLNILDADKGGVTFENSLHLGLQLNFFLKTAHRVLLRVGSFKAKDFPVLEHSLQKLKPKLYQMVSEDQRFAYEVACAKSRLNNEKRVKEVLQKAWGVENSESKQNVYLRFYDDICTVSIDTSGEHLHRRGYRRHISQAPLRETVAAFMLRDLVEDASFSEVACVNLVDPMAGSGTLLFEAKNLYGGEWDRRFAFQKWRSCPVLLQTESYRKNKIGLTPLTWASLTAMDIDGKMGSVIKENGQGINFVEQDFFKAQVYSKRPVWVVSNLPYGARVPVTFSMSQYMDQLQKAFSPERVSLLISQAQSRELEKLPKFHRSLKKTPLKNGGLSVVLWSFK